MKVAKKCFNAANVQKAFQEANDRFKQLVVRYGQKTDGKKKANAKPLIQEVVTLPNIK